MLYDTLRRDGFSRAMDVAAYAVASRVSRGFVGNVHNPGTPVWERDWDVLVVLDACRRDLLREVADEYDFVGGRDDVGAHWSVGSMSEEWLRHTFTDEYADVVERSAYVTGNPYTAKDVFETEPAVLDEVWKYAWNDDLGTVLPRALTDSAIATWREGDVDRMIVHYMQPHVPFVNDPDPDLDGDPGSFREGRDGFWRPGLPLEEVWSAYRDNLRYVLDDVSLLCASMDADTVAITADHGNALGPLGVWGHPRGIVLPSLRRVPWVETTAEDAGGYDPDVDRGTDDGDVDVEDRLRALGYVE